MENYRIYCAENERAEVMDILRRYNDVVIDNMNSTSFAITIERDNPAEVYQELIDTIHREVHQQNESGPAARSGIPAGR